MHKFIHILAHIGLGAIQVANVAYPFVPPPFNVIVGGGAAVAQVIIAIAHKQKP